MDVVLPKPGHYVVAVSGGVDSMALLHILAKEPGFSLTVAHLDHGIRGDSIEDRKLVGATSKRLDLPFVYHEVKLGSGTSEATARTARYDFLHKVAKDNNADGIITAHHQDDVIETAIINMLRGTGRKGLTSLGSSAGILRPLLRVPKRDLIAYAKDQGLVWREDSTNTDEKYLRNYVRHNLVTKLDTQARLALVENLENMHHVNAELDTLLVKHLKNQSVKNTIDRSWFNHLPHNVAREIMATWLRLNDIRDFDTKALERLVVAAKTGKAGKKFPIVSGHLMVVNKHDLALDLAER